MYKNNYVAMLMSMFLATVSGLVPAASTIFTIPTRHHNPPTTLMRLGQPVATKIAGAPPFFTQDD